MSVGSRRHGHLGRRSPTPSSAPRPRPTTRARSRSCARACPPATSSRSARRRSPTPRPTRPATSRPGRRPSPCRAAGRRRLGHRDATRAGNENGPDPIVFTITRTTNVLDQVVLNLGWSGTATYGTDYTVTVTGGDALGERADADAGARRGERHRHRDARRRHDARKRRVRDPHAERRHRLLARLAGERNGHDRGQRRRRRRSRSRPRTRRAPSRAPIRSCSRSRGR